MQPEQDSTIQMTPEQETALAMSFMDGLDLFNHNFDSEDIRKSTVIRDELTAFVMHKIREGAATDHMGAAIVSLAHGTVAGAIRVVRAGPEIGTIHYDS